MGARNNEWNTVAGNASLAVPLMVYPKVQLSLDIRSLLFSSVARNVGLEPLWAASEKTINAFIPLHVVPTGDTIVHEVACSV